MKVFILMCFLILSISCTAQKIRFGAKIGGTLSYFSGEDSENFRGKVRYHAGLLGEYKVINRLGIQLEAYYNRQGADLSNPFFAAVYKFDFVQIPLLAKVYLSEWLAIELGPQIGINVVDNYEIWGQTTGAGNLASPYFSAALGAGYYSPRNVFIQVRHNQSFASLAPDTKMKNPFITISLGYMFGKGE